MTKNLTKINPEKNHSYSLTFSDGETHGPYPYLCLNLGGGSWEDQEVEWPKMMINLGLEFIPFFSANAGFHVKEWTKELIQEIKLQPIKDCTLKTSKGEKRGDLIVTEYGLEGTPVYFVGRPEVVYIDFFPKLKLERLDVKLLDISSKENLNHLRKIKKMFPNHQALHGILFHLNKNINSLSANELSKLLKNFPLTLEKIRPLREAISSKGGISLKECDENLMSVKYPGMFMAGEMLNWSAPTGGYLIQTCVTQGYIVGKALARRYP